MRSAALAALIANGRCKLLLGVSVVFATIGAAVALAPAVILYLIVSIFYNHTNTASLTVMQIVFAAIGAAIVRLTLQLWARLTAGDATILGSASLRARLAEKIGALPMGVLAQGRPAALATQLLDDVETIGLFLSGEFVDLVGSIAMVLAAAAVMAWRDWRVALLLLFLVGAGYAVGMRRGALATGAVLEEERAREALAAATLEALRGNISEKTLPPVPADADPIRIYAGGYRDAIRARNANAAAAGSAWRAYAGALPALLVLFALFLGGNDVPALVLVAALGLRAGGAMTTTLIAARASAGAREGLRRIDQTLAVAPSHAGGADAPAGTSIRWRGVSFAYPGSAQPALREIDVTAEAGKITAIVGPSGSGKTTLLRLAAGFWQPDRGAVEIGGRDLREIDGDALMRRIAYVFQDVYLLNDTIAENLRVGNPDADDAALEHAARAAGAHEFISALPNGYATVVGDRGLTLSRGERQRVQIARALLKDAPIVLLDEPTASLDPATEAEIQEALSALLRGKTVLAVTHRLGTIVDVDRIIVLDGDGRVEAAGTHAQLLHGSPTYARLWADYVEAIDWAAEGEAVG